mgnify:FL=1
MTLPDFTAAAEYHEAAAKLDGLDPMARAYHTAQAREAREAAALEAAN